MKKTRPQSINFLGSSAINEKKETKVDWAEKPDFPCHPAINHLSVSKNRIKGSQVRKKNNPALPNRESALVTDFGGGALFITP